MKLEIERQATINTDLQTLCNKQENLLTRLKDDLTKKQQLISQYEKTICKHEAHMETQMLQMSNQIKSHELQQDTSEMQIKQLET